MRNVAMPLHDRERIARQRPGKDVDVGERCTEGTSHDRSARGGRAQRMAHAPSGGSGRDITTGKERLSGQSAHNSVCDRIHLAGYFAVSGTEFRRAS